MSAQVIMDNVPNIRYTRRSLHRCAVDRSLVDSTNGDKPDTHDEHRIGDLVFAHSTPENYHPGLSRCTSELVQVTDVLYDIDYETWRPERVKI